jgi:hypothetical protein
VDPAPGRSLRRKLAGLVLLLGGVMVGGYLLRSQGSLAKIVVDYHLGAPPRARRLEAVVRPQAGGEIVARFETELIASDVRQRTRLKTGTYQVEIVLVGEDGARHALARTIEARPDATVTIDLSGVPR